MLFFEIVGVVVVLSLMLYLLLFVLYRIFVKELEPSLDPAQMPKLRPVPIPSKNCSFFTKILVWFFKVRQWDLAAHWVFTLTDGTDIVIPKGFRFDGASIPRPFWAILSPTGLLLIPGLIHDYGYKHNHIWKRGKDNKVSKYKQGAGKSYWDKLFLEVGKQVNGFTVVDFIAWLGIVISGHVIWRKHRKAESRSQGRKFKA